MRAIYESSFEDATARPIFADWEPILEWIGSALPSNVLPEDEGTGNPNLGEAFKRNPLWANLWESSETLEFAREYRWLQAHFLVAHARQLDIGADTNSRIGRADYESYGDNARWDALPDLNYKAALRLRQMGCRKWSPFFNRLPMSLDAKRFVRDFSSVHGRPEHEMPANWLKFRNTVRTFLARANGFEPWPIRDSTEKPGQKPAAIASIATEDSTPGDPDDPDTCNWPDGSIVTVAAPLSEDLVRTAIECDLNPDELRDQNVYYVAPSWDTGQLQKLAIERAISVRGQFRQIQNRHQLLPFAYDIPAVNEVRSLLRRLTESWDSLGDAHYWDKQQREFAEMIAVILIQLWFGLTAKRALGLVAVHGQGCKKPTLGVEDGQLIYVMSTAEWIVPIDVPPYRSVILDPARHAHPHLRWLPLQDVAGSGRYIESLLQSQSGFDQPGSGKPIEPVAVFSVTLGNYEAQARAYLRKTESTSRITVRRLGLFAFHRLVAHCGDLMAGALITGRLGTLTRTERFYASYSASSLRNLYFDTATEMVRDVTDQSPPQQLALCNPKSWKGHVGARLCAKDAEVRRAISDLKKACIAIRDVKRASIERHNLLTLYSVMFFCFSTSCRPIRTPYIGLRRVDPDTQFAYLKDKDDDANHKTRLVWLPPSCFEQMKIYERHCDRLRREHSLIERWQDPCFFVSRDGQGSLLKPIRVQPSTLAPRLHKFIRLPLNFYRIYLRHRLLRMGTPPEVVMAWLGHAFAGEELWGTHSSLSPREYIKYISNPLTEILERELKWEVLS